jgi:outer membrane lipoprotein-sorting protein
MYKFFILGQVLMFALATSVTAENKGKEIYLDRERQDTGFEDFSSNMEMLLKTKTGRTSRREIRMQVLEGSEGEGDKTRVIFKFPRDVKGTALLTHQHLEGDDDQWLYMPAFKRTKRIGSRDRTGRFMGTEFLYEDLVVEEVNDYTYRYIDEREYRGKTVHHIERIPISENSAYSRKEADVDQESNQPIRVVYFDRKGKLLKTLEAEEWVAYKGQFWRPNKMTMTNHQTGDMTILTTPEYEFSQGLTQRNFSKSALERVR